ncbi:galactosyltransferase-related protein [Methanobacterium alcaliphilum]|uniref:galactosyltransferase-related protein n=1 Tax=Methanobacterium alcaliphilum TaxID=392018 RepID=UPI00200A7C86|nr:galactosyltransferase-related protein [Methanobacterium alcaliphilum]MCK9152230.1 galactosyltransferase-related protein [Methanobacterium alcaliphilum]
MIKKQVKKHIKRSGTYRVLEIDKNKLESQYSKIKILCDNINAENKSLLNQLKNKEEQEKKLIKSLKNKEEQKRNLNLLIRNLKAENKDLKSSLKDNLINKQKIQNYSNLTVIIPYRKTTDKQREENVEITLNYLSKLGIKNLVISEHSDFSAENDLNAYENLFDSFRVIFSNSNGESFNRSLAANKGALYSKTPYICIHDMDCLAEKINLEKSLNLLDEGFEIVFPFNRRIKDIENKSEFTKSYDFNAVDSIEQKRDLNDGCIVFWNKQSFIEVGMLNEYFKGWGGEDNEIMIRADLLNIKQIRIDEIVYHLYHDQPRIRSKNNSELLRKMLQMDKEEVLNEIRKWPWAIEAKKLSMENKT